MGFYKSDNNGRNAKGQFSGHFGKLHPRWKGGIILNDAGYLLQHQPGHPRAVRNKVRQHILIAESAIGHYLPTGAEVHHVDFNPENNANSNLVICENHKYHRLLHARTRIARSGGDPNIHKFCSNCKELLFKTSFAKSHIEVQRMCSLSICAAKGDDAWDSLIVHLVYLARRTSTITKHSASMTACNATAADSLPSSANVVKNAVPRPIRPVNDCAD
jgi:hypothetical protein